MANTAGGGYHGGQPQFPAYAAGQYYQQHQAYSYPYYTSTPQQLPYGVPQTTAAGRAPPPPPPPPGESSPVSTSATTPITTAPSLASGSVPPLEQPPLPPLFPWMSPALASGFLSSPYGQKFKEEASNLPFVPIVVNDSDLAKMTENVMKETEEINKIEMKWYKDVISQDLPQPLLALFQPLYCKLCTLTLSSPIVSKDHYAGKRHKKAIDNWFAKNMPANQIPINSQAGLRPINGFITKIQNSGPVNPASVQSPQIRQNYPDPSEQNFQQKNNDRKRPAPQPPTPSSSVRGSAPRTGFQDVQPNQLIRPNHNSTPTPSATQNSFNFGGPRGSAPQHQNNASHVNNQNSEFQQKKPKWDGPPPGPTPNQGRNNTGPLPKDTRTGGQGGGGGPPPKDRCELCNVQLSSMVMANQHFNGKNHAARLAALQEGGPAVPLPETKAASGPPPNLMSQQIPPPAVINNNFGSAQQNNSFPNQKIQKQSQQQNSHKPETGSFSSHQGDRGREAERGGARGGGRGGNRGGSLNRGGGGGGGSRPPFNKNNSNRGSFHNINNRFSNSKRGGGSRFN